MEKTRIKALPRTQAFEREDEDDSEFAKRLAQEQLEWFEKELRSAGANSSKEDFASEKQC